MLKIRMRLFSLTVLILSLSVSASALNPLSSIAQYGHSLWSLREGVLPGYPSAIAQTSDGYLWLATQVGLLKFDGAKFVTYVPPSGAKLPSSVVWSLLADWDGGLWVGTAQGLARISKGTLSTYAELAGQHVGALLRTQDGSVWAATNAGQGSALVCRIRLETTECQGRDGLFGRFVLSLFESADGALWVGASNGLWRLGLAEPKVFARSPTPQEIHSIVSDGGPGLVISMSREIRRFHAERLELLSAVPDNIKPTVLMRDRDKNLWIGTQDQGVLRVYGDRLDRFGRADGLSGDFVVSLHEDREGNVWVGTLNGLDRLRDVVAPRISIKQGLLSDTVVSVQSSRDGSVWMSTLAGLSRWRNGVITNERVHDAFDVESTGTLFEDTQGRVWTSNLHGLFYFYPDQARKVARQFMPSRYVDSITEDTEGHLWISDRDRGLVRVRSMSQVDLIPWESFNGDKAIVLAAEPRGGLWLGFINGGIGHYNNNKVERRIGAADGLSNGRVNALYFDSTSSLWVATQGGVSIVSQGKVSALTESTGLPCSTVHWVMEDRERAIWLHTACGLVRLSRPSLSSWQEGVSKLVRADVFDTPDGVLRYADLGAYGPKVTKTADGRIWFASYDGVGVVDSNRLPSNKFPPPVHILLATADRSTIDTSLARTLPPLVRDLLIEYTAVSLTAPEKIRFRYKLEGRDTDWTEPTDRRQAFYTDLAPGSYRFRVIASNDRGVWNEEGATWEFSVAPTVFQTLVFRVSVALMAATMLFAMYRLRMRRLTSELNLRFQERLDERTRIAQDLHDTVLQGIISASMQLHFATAEVNQEARPRLTAVAQRISELVEASRNAVSGLRVGAPDDLDRALLREAEQFRNDQPIAIRIEVSEKRPLDALVRDAAYQIGREALANAFRHAKPKSVDIQIEYGANALVVCVRDDGVGINSGLVESGRAGHWGLQGMHERAERIGGTVSLWSRPGRGTELRFTVPTTNSRRGWWKGRKKRKLSNIESKEVS